jgi:hypothetical protein
VSWRRSMVRRARGRELELRSERRHQVVSHGLQLRELRDVVLGHIGMGKDCIFASEYDICTQGRDSSVRMAIQLLNQNKYLQVTSG